MTLQNSTSYGNNTACDQSTTNNVDARITANNSLNNLLPSESSDFDSLVKVSVGLVAESSEVNGLVANGDDGENSVTDVRLDCLSHEDGRYAKNEVNNSGITDHLVYPSNQNLQLGDFLSYEQHQCSRSKSDKPLDLSQLNHADSVFSNVGEKSVASDAAFSSLDKLQEECFDSSHHPRFISHSLSDILHSSHERTVLKETQFSETNHSETEDFLQQPKLSTRRRSLSDSNCCWGSKCSAITAAMKRLFRCNREDSRSRARDSIRSVTVSTLSGAVGNTGVANVCASFRDEGSSGFVNSVKGFQKGYFCDKSSYNPNSPSLAVKSVKKAQKIGPSEDGINLNVRALGVADVTALNNSVPAVVLCSGLNQTISSSSSGPSNDQQYLEASMRPDETESSRNDAEGVKGAVSIQDNVPFEKESKNADGCMLHNLSINNASTVSLNNYKVKLTTREMNVSKSKAKKCVDKSSSLIPEVDSYRLQKVRSKRLMKEFKDLTKITESVSNPPFTISLVDDNLFEWKIKLYHVDEDSLLYRDMVAYGVPFILLNMTFPESFPFEPPFLRVISPRIEKGYVLEGGAICMELLTPRGWASAYTIEAVIMQLTASLSKGKARIGRQTVKEFNKRAAEASFKALVRTHDKYGWVTPPLSEG